MASTSKIILRIPTISVVNRCIVRRWHGNVTVTEPIIHRDRTYVLGDNVKYIEYDKDNKNGCILIHYVNDTCDELSHKEEGETHKLYEKIIDVLKESGTFIDYQDM